MESKPAFVPDIKAQNPISAVRFWLDKYLNFFSLGFNNLKMGITISHLVEKIKYDDVCNAYAWSLAPEVFNKMKVIHMRFSEIFRVGGLSV